MTNRMTLTAMMGLAAMIWPRPSLAQHRGIDIKADPNGRFEYRDDFTTAKFLDDAFLENVTVDRWQKGSLSNNGPDRGRSLTYRFHGDRTIKGIDVSVDQRANQRNLGGVSALYLSLNGLDWTQVAS
ncbi:MAG: hypothetical protein JXQ73_19085, partial [Phycisphaerae bacterium]|nr:hypothetical protein [Phycisphaerae bacterium]